MDDIAPPLAPLDEGNGEGNRDPHGDDSEWLSINAAARRLGVTATAIRNRIKRRTLDARPNGNFGKLVRVPLTVPVTVIRTPEERVRVTVPLTPAEEVPATVPLTVTLTVLSDHITSLKAALAKAEGEIESLKPERERADRLEVEVAVIPGLQEANEALKETIEALKAALETEQSRLAEIRAERDRLLSRSVRRRWWWRRSA